MPDIEKLEAALDTASKKLGLPTQTDKAAENRYGQAYQALVQVGARQPLRAKYRG